jgi:ssDNA-binding Zn-finger/Zn-ribbon topoisomerase 1
MNGPEFDQLLVAGFRRWGFGLAEKRPAEAPVDYVLRRGKDTYLVHCKQMLAKSVSVDALRALDEAMTASGAAGGYCLTTGAFTPEAEAFARERKILLLDGPRLSEMLRKARSDAREEPNCPQCGKRMVKRFAKQGAYAGQMIWGCARFPDCKAILVVEDKAASAAAAANEAERRAIEALRKKFGKEVDIKPIETLPFAVFDLDVEGWLLFCLEREKDGARQNKYVAVHPSGKMRMLAAPGGASAGPASA